jgi:hypothetical protein
LGGVNLLVRSTYGQSKSPAEKLREYNNVTYKDGETIRSFNLHFTKLYNQIPELICPQNQAAFMHYYNALPSPYHHRLEEKAIDNLGSLCTLAQSMRNNLNELVYPRENQLDRWICPALLQLVQDMNNRMIAFEWKGTVNPLTPGASSSSAPPFRSPVENNFQPKAILPRSWCNFCEEHHEETTCEVRKSARDKIFGKRPEATIVVLDFSSQKMSWSSTLETKPMPQKENLTLLAVLLARVHPQPLLHPRLLKFLRVKESLPLPPLPNTIS